MFLDFWRLAVVTAVLAGASHAQLFGQPTNYSMCSWAQVRVNRIRDTVYLDGGNHWWMQNHDTGMGMPNDDGNPEGILYTFDLSSSFNTKTSNLTSLFGEIEKAGGAANNLAPNYEDGVMFANDHKLYLYGGLYSPRLDQDDPPADTVLSYERYFYGTGAEYLWETGSLSESLDGLTRYVTHGAGVSAPSENLGFYVSGLRAPDWGPIWNNGTATELSQQMITVDMSEMRDAVWSNRTIPDYVPARAGAEAVWLPVSESGIVVLIGGANPIESIYPIGLEEEEQAESRRVSPGFMERVAVYDVAGDTWYVQNTTGDIPPQRAHFCSVYASASDNSSHNIYIYGGYDGVDTMMRPSDDAYVLSLPSFEWVKLYSGDSAVGRKMHKCVKPYPDKMLVFGGKGIDVATCLDMIRVFNLNTGRFQDAYNPADWEEYQVPALVSGRIGGDGSGGATRTSPESWTNSSLEDVFATAYTKPIATWYPYDSPNDNTTIVDPPTSGSSSGFPNWAGAIIGVVLGLILIAALATWWFLRRRRRNSPEGAHSESSRDSRVAKWVHAGAFSPPGVKDLENSTVVSGGQTNESTVTASVTTGYSRPTAEVGGEPVYEMHGQSAGPILELPTPYNEGIAAAQAETSAGTPATSYISPVSPALPQEKEAHSVSPEIPQEKGAMRRPTHTRNMSSLSSVQSSSVSEADEGVQRPRYVSGVSEASVSSMGTTGRFGEGGQGNRGLGLEDIPDTEGER
ncbi:hypothetical protein BJX61DRAFT_540139 [Aspergillus egyptiacus]|nr:hypothetical protein BJX61DRAFT_540139 [Aspergillus egyptiacus]